MHSVSVYLIVRFLVINIMNDCEIEKLCDDALLASSSSLSNPLEIIDNALMIFIDCRAYRNDIHHRCLKYFKTIQREHTFTVKT